MKRTADILGSSLGLLFFAPLLSVIALMIKVDSPGPVFFLQERVGREKKLFKIFKFRTMVPGAEKIGAGYEVSEGDFRITRVGQFLRRWSLDELPQLINVLRGEMSLVGPRPTLLYQVEAYSPRQMKRLEVKPGMTGLAQVSGRNSLSWPERIELDVRYAENFSLFMDFLILAMTPLVLLKKDMIYTPEMKNKKEEMP